MLAFLTNALFFAYFSLFGSFTNIIAKPISDDGALWGVVLLFCVVAVAL